MGPERGVREVGRMGHVRRRRRRLELGCGHRGSRDGGRRRPRRRWRHRRGRSPGGHRRLPRGRGGDGAGQGPRRRRRVREPVPLLELKRATFAVCLYFTVRVRL